VRELLEQVSIPESQRVWRLELPELEMPPGKGRLLPLKLIYGESVDARAYARSIFQHSLAIRRYS
jgi:hypothetical protein